MCSGKDMTEKSLKNEPKISGIFQSLEHELKKWKFERMIHPIQARLYLSH